MINLSDDSEQEDDEFEPEMKGSSLSTPPGSFHAPWTSNTMPNMKNRSASVSVSECHCIANYQV